MRINIIQYVMRLSLVLVSNFSVAGDITNVSIRSTVSTQSNATREGVLFIILPFCIIDEPPICGAGTNYRYAIKGEDKVMISQALMAFASSKRVDITGSGSCDAWADTESVCYLTVHN